MAHEPPPQQHKQPQPKPSRTAEIDSYLSGNGINTKYQVKYLNNNTLVRVEQHSSFEEAEHSARLWEKHGAF